MLSGISVKRWGYWSTTFSLISHNFDNFAVIVLVVTEYLVECLYLSMITCLGGTSGEGIVEYIAVDGKL